MKVVDGFKAMVITWLGVPKVGPTNAADAAELAGVLSAQSVLKLSAVWACARLISETIATLPLGIYERTSAGKRPAPQHPLHFILHDQPNVDTTAAVHIEATVATMLLRGNARAEKLMIGDRLVGVEFLHPDRLSRDRPRNGWRYREEEGDERFIPDARIWNIPGFSLDGKTGVSVISYGAKVFGSALAADAAALGTFERGLLPTTAFTYPTGVMTPEQRVEARGAIKRISGALNAGEPAVFEAGMTAMAIGIKPEEAQLLESRAFSVEEICRWFRVPPFMVGHSEKSTSWGTGIEQQMIGFLTFTLAPWLKRIEQSINLNLLPPGDRARYYAKFNVEGLLRADSAGRAAMYASMVDHGISTRDECREKEDLPPKGGNAAVLTVQSAMTPLDSLGAPAQTPQPAGTNVAVHLPEARPRAYSITRDADGAATLLPLEP